MIGSEKASGSEKVSGSGKVSGSEKASRPRLLAAVLCSAVAILPSGCLAPDPDPGNYLGFQNPELTDGLDSLRILGVNAQKRDTLLVQRWSEGENFPAEAPYPPGLEASFTLLVRGYRGESLVYESHTAVTDGKAQAQMRDMRMAAPALPDWLADLTARVGIRSK